MERREFLKAAGLATLAGVLPGWGLNSYGLSAFALNERKAQDDHKLVVVFLRGALDGLSVLVPYDDPRY